MGNIYKGRQEAIPSPVQQKDGGGMRISPPAIDGWLERFRAIRETDEKIQTLNPNRNIVLPQARPKIGIVVPFSWEFAPKFFIRSMHMLERWEGCPLIYVDGGTVYAIRNAGVAIAREKGCDAVLFCDADMTCDPDAMRRLADHNLPIVVGLCYKRRKPFNPVLYKRMGSDFFLMEPKGNGLLPVDATGGAFLYVQMHVFDAIKPPYFCNREAIAERVLNEVDFLGEDLFFCEKAGDAGFPIYVDLDVLVGHIVTGIVKGNPKTYKPEILLA